WAQGKAHTLMARLVDDPKNRALRDEIIGLAETYHLASTLEMVQRRGFLEPLRDLLPFGEKK
ncbi:MAG: hypothetical protein V1918_01870, partial [Planctomycetota bacterium]